VEVTARLKKRVTLAQVQHRLDALWPRLLAETIPPGQSLEEWTRTAGAQARVLPGSRGIVWTDDRLPRATVALFFLAGLVLLAMCSNLAGLLLSRGLSRQMEFAVRMALGATRGDVVRHALAEVFVLSVFGGLAAILLAIWLTRLCSELLSLGNPVGFLGLDYRVRVDGRVAAFAVVAALATAMAAQIIAALRFSSMDIGDLLRLGGLNVSARFSSRKVMLAIQVAAAMVLVSGSVVFVRTLQLLARVDGGFRTEGVLIFRLAGRMPWSEGRPEFFQELLRRVRAIPSVAAAGLADRVPMEWNYDTADPISASHGSSTLEVKSDSGCTWPGFFEALKIPLVAGRDFRESDQDAVLLTRELAHGLFRGVDPLGSYVRIGKAPQVQTLQVIGVIGDVRFRSPRQEETRMFFAPCRQVWKGTQTSYAMSLAVRARGAPAEVESAVRREIEAMGRQAVYQVISLEGLVAKSTRNESILATIAAWFGAFTLVLTCAGVYALIDLTASARRRELGIRMALGANGRIILQLLLKDLVRVIGLGACAGLVVTAAVARVYRAFLYGMAESEPLLMSLALAIVILSALAAALLPAWRAARLDPGSVLRHGAEGR
jgi:predicted permease